MNQFSTVDDWITGLVIHKNDNHETVIRKKFFFVASIVALFFVSLIASLGFLLEVRKLAVYMLLFLALTVIQSLTLVIVRKWSRWYIYSVFFMYLVLIFYVITGLGGIANSAGLLMIAYFFLLMAQWMEDTRLLFFVGILYVLGVILTGFAYPYLKADESLEGWKNNLFFVINFGWIGLLIAVALYVTIVKGEKEARKRALQLQDFELLKSHLYAKIAHEFKNPLTLIKGHAQEIGERLQGSSCEKAASIIRNSDKVLFLVNRMLNLSKVEEREIKLQYVQSDIGIFVSMVTDTFREYASMKKLKLEYRTECSGLRMDFDPDLLEEALSNLLSNAIKYTPEGGKIVVTVSLKTYEEGEGQCTEIMVSDSGIGIAENQMERIFMRFYRVEDERFPFEGGSGIGLTLVSEYMKLMNGSVKVKSRSGSGSEFLLSLPVTQNAPVCDALKMKGNFFFSEYLHSNLTLVPFNDCGLPILLIIEDNRELIHYLCDLLKDQYSIIAAIDGKSGVELALGHVPDAIICDVMMPVKDGYQVCRELKNNFQTNHIPIVLLTARADFDSRIKGFECGADAYLTKPFDKQELLASLRQLFVMREKLRLKYQSALYEMLPVKNGGDPNTLFLNSVLKILEKNYQDDHFRIEELYSQLGISRVQLHRKLTSLTGLSASGFISGFRLHKARKLLFATDMNVSEVARATGFSDPNYFTRVFHREFGLSPSDMRRMT